MAGPSLLPPLFVTWQPGPVPRRKGAPLGLKNMENTCYLKPSSVSVEGGNWLETTCKGSQVDRVFWECPNPKVPGLQKVAANEHIAGMLNAVENSVENGHRV